MQSTESGMPHRINRVEFLRGKWFSGGQSPEKNLFSPARGREGAEERGLLMLFYLREREEKTHYYEESGDGLRH